VHTHFLSNGRYTTALTNAGGGYSMWRDMAVTRRREDPTSDAGAHYIYLRDPWSKRVWSATHLPIGQEPDQFDAVFELDKASFRRRDGDFETQLEITVSSEDDVEVRRLTIRNRGRQTRELEVTSYVEMVLARLEDDLAHPAFGKLFIETEFDPQSAGLIFPRRPRAADESPAVGFHVLGVDTATRCGRMGDRSRRPRPRPHPRQSGGGRRPGPVRHDWRFDPIGSVRERLRLPPGASVRVAGYRRCRRPQRRARFARKYSTAAPPRAFSMAFTHVHITLQHLGLNDEQAMLFDRLASRVFGSDNTLISPTDLAANVFGQPNLWGFGISGDLPIVLVRVLDTESLPLVRQLLNAQEYWRVKELRADLVILNEHPADYLDEVQLLLTQMLGAADGMARETRRHDAAPRRRHGRRRSPSARCRRQGGPAGRPRRPRPATGTSGSVAVRRGRCAAFSRAARSGEQRRIGLRAAAGHEERTRRIYP
jgi:cyclic beta-1,2-glucan synthetase